MSCRSIDVAGLRRQRHHLAGRGQHDQPVAAEHGTGPVDRAGLVLLVAKARQRTQPADLSVLALQADRLVVAGQHENKIAADPRPVTAADLLLPGALAGAQVDRRHAAAMADRVGPAAIDDRPPANIGETGDRVGGPRRGQIVGPDHAAVLGPQPEHLARAVADHDDLARSTAGLAPPSRPAVSGMPLWVHKRRPSSADSTSSAFSTLTAKTRPSATVGGACSGAVTFWRQITLPSAGSSASDLTVSGRHEQPIVPEARAAAEGAAALVLRLQIDRPDAAAGGERRGR